MSNSPDQRKRCWLEDDALPFLDPYSGTEIFAEAFGCRVYRPENDMPFALPPVHQPAEATRLKVRNLDLARTIPARRTGGAAD